MKPNLFIVGAPKCGTTAWVKYLGDHPDIYFPEIKEPHYFLSEAPQRREIKTLKDYLALFENSGDATIVGEASVRYLNSAAAAANIGKFNPDAKIIIFVRDHADYLASWHSQLLYNGDDVVRDFGEAWRRSIAPGRPEAGGPAVPDYRQEALFNPKIERFFNEFPAERIRVIHFNDWTAHPRATYAEILHFLGVEDDGRRDFPVVNEARHHRTAFVTRLVRNPPTVIRRGIELVKKLTGRRALGLANLALRLDSRSGTNQSISPELKQEIRAYFRDDDAALRKWLWKPPVQQ